MNTDMRSPLSVIVHHATRHLAWTVSLFVASLMVHAVARGATITNANDVTVNVELPGAWVGGVAPGASDTAVFEAVNLATFASGTVTAENFQVSPANPLYSFKIADGKVKLSCANGMQIIYR